MLLFRKRAEMPSPDRILPGRPIPPTEVQHFVNGHPLKGSCPDGLETAVFGLDCFWGAKRKFRQPGDGVFVTALGYAAGTAPDPT